ncbi:MAG: hypothetical protein F6J93_30745 [Oscillatoria sp. SIO1A7]|nr:hypothetical protein [Oscillatoria sp. SIO1A7]
MAAFDFPPVYPDCINEFYSTEVAGEAWALGLLKVAKNDIDRYHFGTFLQLETENKAHLGLLLYKYNLYASLSEDENLNEEVDKSVDQYQDSDSLREFASSQEEFIEKYLDRFQEIQKITPEEDLEIVDRMVKHEEAILYWVETLSLEKIIDLLANPLPEQP